MSVFDLKDLSTIELDEIEYQNKLIEAKSLKLQETANDFIYSELVSSHQDKSEVRVFQWEKKKFNDWFKEQSILKNHKVVSISKFYKLKIDVEKTKNINKSSSIDTWEVQNMPDARQQHTVV